MQFSQTPTYNLKAVINETGIKAATLRIWERRYGLPAPARSPGRQRLYSRFDIEVIRWLLTRQAEGSRISQAVEQYYSLLADGQNPFIQTPLETVSNFQAPSSSAFSHLDALREQWLSACKAFDENTAEKLLNQSFALYSVELVCSQI
jgi:MerR family transcriptional regulator, light-induced transcriptional regulator